MREPLRVYVAASSAELDRYRAARTALVMAGHEVYDWSAAHRPTAELSNTERYEAASDDLSAIWRADVLWLLAPSVRSDALWEAGYVHGLQACGLGPTRIVVSGPVAARGIFAAHHEEHDDDAAALCSILAWAREAAA